MHVRSALRGLLAFALSTTVAQAVQAQSDGELGRADALRIHHPELFDLVLRLETAQGVLFEEMARVQRTGSVNDPEGDLERVARLDAVVRGQAKSDARGAAAAGYARLGPRGADIVRWGQAFQREVLSILADPDVADRSAALDAAVRRYESRPESALPDVPKDMEVLYGHPYALGFRTSHPDLDGFVWSGHWLKLAATEPLTDLEAGSAREAGLDTVRARFAAKLANGEPPQSYPTELPLAPAIAPGLIWLSPEAAMIWDNLSMLLEVVADVMSSADPDDAAAALSAAFDFFQDPEAAVTDQDEWEIMALRHGIFFQGGFPLAVMTESERNTGGHAAHLAGGAMLMTIPGMPRR